MDAMNNTQGLAVAPLKPHAFSAPHADDLSSALRHALREVSAEDPDLLATIVGRSSVVGGKNKCKQEGQQATPASSCGPEPPAQEEHDRSYFALLKKISQLEADNLRLENHVAMIKEDTMAYEEVARELEDDLNVVTAENALNIATIAELKTTQGKSQDIAKRLVSAERTIVQLRAQLQTGDTEQDMIGLNKLVMAAQSTEACRAPLCRAATRFESSETIVLPTALPEALALFLLMEELNSMEDSQHILARVTLDDITWRACEVSNDCLLSRAMQQRPKMTESTSISYISSDTEDVNVSTSSQAGARDAEQDMIGLNMIVMAAQSTEACFSNVPLALRRAATQFELSETIVPPSALPEDLVPFMLMEELNSMEDSQHVRTRVTLDDIPWRACEVSDDCLLSRAIQQRPKMTESTSITYISSDTEDVNVSTSSQAGARDAEEDMIGLNTIVVAAQSTEACCSNVPLALRRDATQFELSETIVPPSALPEDLVPFMLMEELNSVEDSQHVRARVTLDDINWRACEVSDDCLHSRATQQRPTMTESTSITYISSDTEDVRVSTCNASVGLTYSLLRVHMQRAAVEYRLAVREHLQSVARQGSQDVPRSCLSDLFSTPRDILDDEVLSEDDGESDLCRSRMRLSGEFCNISWRSMC